MLLVCLFVQLRYPAAAQVVYGSIFGTVTDPTGAGVPNVKLTITNTGTNTTVEVTTNQDGNFNRGQLIAGTYRVTVEAPGFNKSLNESVPVSVDVATRSDFQLRVGDVSEQIVVTAEAPFLRSDRAEVNTILTSRQILDLPTFNRNLQSLQLLTPGTTQLNWQHASSENPQGSVQIQVNGQHFSGTDFQLDGTSNQDPILGIIVINPTIDSVIEVKTATQNYDAEYGLAAAGVQTYTTKSGTNELHGSLFHFGRWNTPGFQSFARNPFNNAENNGVPPVKWNQFGGSIGGPIIKNKLFGFADAQLTRRRTGSSVQTSVPLPETLQGDFSRYLEPIPGSTVMVPDTAGNMVLLQRNQIFDPRTGNATTGVGRQAFAGNRIPLSQLSPQGLALLRRLPGPNNLQAGTAAFRRNYVATGSEDFDSEQWNSRMDWFASDTQQMFGRFSFADYRKEAPPAFGALNGGPALDNLGFAGNSQAKNRSLAIGYNKTWTPTLISEIRFGWMRYQVDVLPGDFGTTPARDVGIPNLNRDNTFTSGMPNFRIFGDGGTDIGYGLGANQCNCPLSEDESQYQIATNTTKTVGNHNIRFGADLRFARNLRVPSDEHRSGVLEFDNARTGYLASNGDNPQSGIGLAGFLLGDVTRFRRYFSTNEEARERQRRFFFYGQDTWRVTSKLQLNYGLRWEMIFPESVNKPGNGGQLDLRTGEIVVAGVGGNPLSMLQGMNWRNFAPRLGVTYQVSNRTVVRAGYGWGYALGTFGSIFGHNVTQNLPVLARQNVNPDNNFDRVFSLAVGPQDPTFPQANQAGRFRLPDGVRGNARPDTVRLPRSMSYNLTVQHQLTKDLSIDAGYVGNVGRHVFNGDGPDLNVNQPNYIPGSSLSQNQRRPYFSQFGWTQDVFLYCNCSTNRYDSLQVNVDKRFSGGLSGRLSYTLQDSEGDSGDAYTFLYNRELGRGPRDFLSRHNIVAPVTFEIPIGRGRKFGGNLNRAFDLLVGGWGTTSAVTWRSGRPFTPDLPDRTGRPDVGPSGRPDRGPGDPYEGAPKDRERWFSGNFGAQGSNAAFLIPGANTFGNYGYNNLFGPQFTNVDMSAYKRFLIREGIALQFRTEAFNLFNHTNLGDPNNNVQNAEVGRITGLAPNSSMRRLQFALRLDF
ncbi:MAG: TonB-dependent receptor [Bryobacteraceae bacterium]|nr:TonB-dependent receptor [Bryobacteraceae bacterium]